MTKYDHTVDKFLGVHIEIECKYSHCNRKRVVMCYVYHRLHKMIYQDSYHYRFVEKLHIITNIKTQFHYSGITCLQHIHDICTLILYLGSNLCIQHNVVMGVSIIFVLHLTCLMHINMQYTITNCCWKTYTRIKCIISINNL